MSTSGPATSLAVERGTLSRMGQRIGVLLGSHTLVDAYSAVVPPILAILETRLDLTRSQTAWLLGIGSVSSGVCQPIAAWLSDRFDTRIFGPIGAVLAAVCICMIGSAQTFPQLVLLYAIGMMGVGMFHPVGASSTGQLAEQRTWPGRSVGMSLFFVAGMIGGVIGSFAAPRIVGFDNGFAILRWLLLPGLIGAAFLLMAIRHVPHRHEHHRAIQFESHEVRTRWGMMSLLYIANAMRFTINMTLFYLLLRWAKALLAAAHPEWSEQTVSTAASAINGSLNACVIVGMAIGGITAGMLVRAGREKWPLVLQPIVFAPFVACFSLVGEYGGYLLAIMSGIGFAAMIPVSLSLGQRLLPHRTSLSAGLLLGGAWTIAVLGPPAAEACLSEFGLTLGETFGLLAGLMALSGLVLLPLRSTMPD